MTKTQDTLRRMYIENLTRQLRSDPGISTRINMYMVEVQLMKDLASVLVGCDVEVDSDEFHDFICSFVDGLHHKFDC